MINDYGNIDMQETYLEAQKGKIDQATANKIIKKGFDDYNNDYYEEIPVILTAIFKSPHIVIEKEDTYKFLHNVIFEGNIDILFSNYRHKNLEYTEKDFQLVMNNLHKIDEESEFGFNNYNKAKFIEDFFNQKDLKLTNLFVLELLSRNREVGEQYLRNDNLLLSNVIADFVNTHDYYKEIVKDKKIEIYEDNSEDKLSKELLETQKYLNEIKKQEKKGLQYDTSYFGNFLNTTYAMIFDETNTNRDKFSVQEVHKRMQIAVDTIEQQKARSIETMEELREKLKNNPNNPFNKFKKK